MLDFLNIKKLAADAGFDLCGLAPCRHLVENESMLRAWLGKGYQSSLAYMERNVEKRADPRKLVEGARTAVVCAVSYKNRVGEGYPPGHRTKVASYACAADYHATLRTMLGGMLDALRAAHPGLGGRAFVDTAPLAEKQLAVEAGLGWIGRQSLLVTPQYGSYVLLGELTQYNPELLDKERLLAVTKCDMLDEDLIAEMRGHLPEGVPSVFISSVSGLNIPRLKDMLWEALQR